MEKTGKKPVFVLFTCFIKVKRQSNGICCVKKLGKFRQNASVFSWFRVN